MVLWPERQLSAETETSGLHTLSVAHAVRETEYHNPQAELVRSAGLNQSNDPG
jgi:hypothetical protein